MPCGPMNRSRTTRLRDSIDSLASMLRDCIKNGPGLLPTPSRSIALAARKRVVLKIVRRSHGLCHGQPMLVGRFCNRRRRGENEDCSQRRGEQRSSWCVNLSNKPYLTNALMPDTGCCHCPGQSLPDSVWIARGLRNFLVLYFCLGRGSIGRRYSSPGRRSLLSWTKGTNH